MKAVLLDGARPDDGASAAVRSVVRGQLERAGFAVQTMTLADLEIAQCMGDFHCWIRTPGVCVVDDDNRCVAAAMVGADLMVWITPITFGGYSSTLKKAVDHLVQNVSPSFVRIGGEVHHRPRYARYPSLFVIGVLPHRDSESEGIFATLAWRNAVNLFAPSFASVVVYGDQPPAAIHAFVARQLGSGALPFAFDPAARLPVHHVVAAKDDPAAADADRVAAAPARALLLVGSPRAAHSTSESLGSWLMERLQQRGVATATLRLLRAVGSRTAEAELQSAVAAADTIVLAAPLYVDSLPAMVVRALELLADAGRRQPAPRLQRLCAILNCGFPEAAHNDTAMAICRRFAREAGFQWGGGLALGGGQGVVGGRPLRELGDRALQIVHALDLAADAIATGLPIPPAAIGLMAKATVPKWLYTLFGNFGWRRRARAQGAEGHLSDRPYQAHS